MTASKTKTFSSCRDTSQQRNLSRRQCRRGKALSAVAWSTMVLASPALGLTGVQRRTPAHSRVTWKSTETCTRIGRRFTSRSELRYRDGDDEESDTRRLEHAVAASHVRLPPVPSKALRRWFGSVVSPNEGSRTPLPSSSCKDSQEQFRLDDYLEFVDKRYHRLHDDDDAPMDGGRQGINTAWNWLMKQKPSSDLEAQKGKEDALCVLGLAELASEELLQKHHLPLPKSEALRHSYEVTTEVVIDAQAQETSEERSSTNTGDSSLVVEPKSLPTNGRVASLSAGLSVLRRIHERQAAIAALRLRAALFSSLRATGKSFVTSIRSLLKAIPALIAMGGGTKTLKTAAVVATAVLMILQPITRVAMEA